MPLLIALSLYGGVFAGYVLGDFHVAETIQQEVSPDMEAMRKQMAEEIKKSVNIHE